MIVSPNDVHVCTRYKNKNTPKTQKNNNPLKTKTFKISKCKLEGALYLYLACQGSGSPPTSPSVTPLLSNVLIHATASPNFLCESRYNS